MNEREREIVRFALAYLAAYVEDFLGDWPEFFVDSGDFPALKGQPPTENEINDPAEKPLLKIMESCPSVANWVTAVMSMSVTIGEFCCSPVTNVTVISSVVGGLVLGSGVVSVPLLSNTTDGISKVRV